MNNPLVSIIIPTYNRAHIIHETLDSVLSQSYTNWKCIVVDDGSTDTTEEVLKSYVKKDARFQYNKRPIDRKKGANACRNYGLDLAKGAYIVFFDSDDVFYYVYCDFMSRNNIEKGQITLHPGGVPHGPHPGAIERSIGKKETGELAVMIDPFKPVSITDEALKLQVEDYHKSWLE